MDETTGLQNDALRQQEEEQIDVMQQKIKEYREMLKKKKPDLDIELLFRILRIMNGSSKVFVSHDPIAEDGLWDSTAPIYAVSGVIQLDDGRWALRTSGDKNGMTVDKLESKLKKAFKHDPGTGKPVLYVRGETVTQLTDAYSHALVREKWAGLPFDLILAVKTPKNPAGESEAKSK